MPPLHAAAIPRFRDLPCKTVERHWLCDVEGCPGELVYQNQTSRALRARHLHQCTHCGSRQFSEAVYPCFHHVVVDQPSIMENAL